MSEVDDGMNFCAGMAPEWANEVRHPDMHSTEYWRQLGDIASEDSGDEVMIGVVQNGADGVPQVSIGGVRFSDMEALDYRTTIGVALRLIGGEVGALVVAEGCGSVSSS